MCIAIFTAAYRTHSVRSRKPLVEDALFGRHAALARHMAKESYFRQSAVTWDPQSKTSKR